MSAATDREDAMSKNEPKAVPAPASHVLANPDEDNFLLAPAPATAPPSPGFRGRNGVDWDNELEYVKRLDAKAEPAAPATPEAPPDCSSPAVNWNPPADSPVGAPRPVPMALWCPFCGMQHVDEGEWATRPHKTHQCQYCGQEWRLLDFPTVGIPPVGVPPAGTPPQDKLSDATLKIMALMSRFDQRPSEATFGDVMGILATLASPSAPAPAPQALETFAEQLHIWYLEACRELDPKSFNAAAQKSYAELTEQQKFIDRYIAGKILAHAPSAPAGTQEDTI